MKPLAELKQRIALAWSIIRDKDGNMVSHAQRELAGSYESGDEMNIQMANHLVDMVRVFSVEGHSGFSASYAASALNALLRFEPLGPLMGVETEWNHVGDQNGKPLYQNNRSGRVFKEGDYAYDIDRIAFREPSGGCFTGRLSRRSVEFPYTPKTVYVDVPDDSTDAQRIELIEKAAMQGAFA